MLEKPPLEGKRTAMMPRLGALPDTPALAPSPSACRGPELPRNLAKELGVVWTDDLGSLKRLFTGRVDEVLEGH